MINRSGTLLALLFRLVALNYLTSQCVIFILSIHSIEDELPDGSKRQALTRPSLSSSTMTLWWIKSWFDFPSSFLAFWHQTKNGEMIFVCFVFCFPPQRMLIYKSEEKSTWPRIFSSARRRRRRRRKRLRQREIDDRCKPKKNGRWRKPKRIWSCKRVG